MLYLALLLFNALSFVVCIELLNLQYLMHLLLLLLKIIDLLRLIIDLFLNLL